jgi:hypothetical protein
VHAPGGESAALVAPIFFFVKFIESFDKQRQTQDRFLDEKNLILFAHAVSRML